MEKLALYRQSCQERHVKGCTYNQTYCGVIPIIDAIKLLFKLPDIPSREGHQSVISTY
jgi:hypothetical protein